MVLKRSSSKKTQDTETSKPSTKTAQLIPKTKRVLGEFDFAMWEQTPNISWGGILVDEYVLHSAKDRLQWKKGYLYLKR